MRNYETLAGIILNPKPQTLDPRKTLRVYDCVSVCPAIVVAEFQMEATKNPKS